MKKILILFISLLIINISHSQPVNISNGNVFDGEPFIAINPINAQNIVVARIGYVFGAGNGTMIRVASSFDGGQTWSTPVNMPHEFSTHKSADPSMVFDQSGNLYISYVDFRQSPDSGGVLVAKSIDGGLNWSTPVKAIDGYDDGTKLPVDRPWLTVNGNGTKLFLTTKPAPWIAAPNRPYFVFSDDGGSSWKPWRYIDTLNYLVGNTVAAPMAIPAVSINDIFYCVYPSYKISQSVYPQFFMASSIDGLDFEHHLVGFTSTPAANDTAKLGYQLIADPKDQNHLVLVYLNAPFGDIDVVMTETYDAGNSWTTPQRVNDDAQGNGKMQDMVWAAFDTSGTFVVTWRDRRNSPGTGFKVASEFYAALRYKDSTQFENNFSISSGSTAYNPILANDGNDFMSVAFHADTLNAVWANTADGSLDVWFVRIKASTAVVTSVSLIESNSSALSVFPNPVSSQFTVQSTRNTLLTHYAIYNMEGKKILSGNKKSYQYELDLSDESPGIYLLTIESENKIYTQKIVKK